MKLTSTALMSRTAASLAVALAILFIFIKPAEFDFDPLGSRALLGIKGLSTIDEVRSVDVSDMTHASIFHLAPFESIEVKYRPSKGASNGVAESCWQLHRRF